jgi:hypothetical protein
MDSSRELASIYVIGFLVRLYLILLIGVQTSDVTGLKFSPEEPNSPLAPNDHVDLNVFIPQGLQSHSLCFLTFD